MLRRRLIRNSMILKQLGLDPTSTPSFVQHVAAFKAHLDLVQDAVKQMHNAARPADASVAQPADSAAQAAACRMPLQDAQPAGLAGCGCRRSTAFAHSLPDATAQAAAEEQCFRAVVDLREVANKLDKHKFQDKAKLLDDAENKAMFVPGDKLLSMFDSGTWTQCLSEFVGCNMRKCDRLYNIIKSP